MNKTMELNSRKDAFKPLEQLGAPKHLLTHVTLVGEAADLVLEKCKELKLTINLEFIRMEVML